MDDKKPMTCQKIMTNRLRCLQAVAKGSLFCEYHQTTLGGGGGGGGSGRSLRVRKAAKKR